MANQEHLDILKQGVEAWNQWRKTFRYYRNVRKEHPGIRPDLNRADLIRTVLSEADLSSADLSGANLSFANLSFANLSSANLSSANLSSANLGGADLSTADLSRADLSTADLTNVNLRGARLNSADLHFADLFGAYLSWADLSDANLSNTILFGAYFREANLSGANLSEADLSRANFFWPDIRAIDVTGSQTAYQARSWFWKKPTSAPSGANLSGANLSGAYLSGADLSEADLSGAHLGGADLRWANLSRANLSRADLTGCFVYATSAWDVQLEETIQANLIITASADPKDPSITVDNLEVAQFIYLLLNNQKIRQTIDTITSQVVLLLGRFPPDRKEVIDALSKELRSQKYSPMVFNFEGTEDKDVTETVRTLANMARFVLLDLTDLDETIREITDEIVPRCVVPIRPLLLQGSHRQEDELFRELRHKYRWVLAPYRYKDLPDLQSSFQEKIIQPINEKIIELKQKKPLKIFLGYAPEDESLLMELKKHLSLLERSGQIKMWDDLEIKPGEEREKEIERHLSEARIILLLVSPDFIASDACQAIQERAVERYEQAEASIIPILLRPCAWQSTPLKDLQPLPRDSKPISQHNKDNVFFEVSEGIGEVIKSLG